MNLLEKSSKFKKFFPNHSLCNIRTLFIMLQCILISKTTCLYKCRDKVAEVTDNYENDPNSNYIRLIRFFKLPQLSSFIEGIFKIIHVIIKEEYKYLALDRTNWKFGKKNINLLTLGFISYHVFTPLCWIQLNKRGNSNFNERKNLINKYLTFFVDCPLLFGCLKPILLADREFIGVKWIEFLVKKQISFVIRLRENLYFELISNGKRVCLKNFRKMVERYGIYTVPMKLNGKIYTFVMAKNLKYDPKHPYIYFISDLTDSKAILEHYLKRWKIECCFKHLKSNGFNLEDIHLKSDEKIELFMGLLTITYILALQEGLLKQKEKKIPIKKYKNGTQYPAISIFRLGLSHISAKLRSLDCLTDYCVYLIKDKPPVPLNHCISNNVLQNV